MPVAVRCEASSNPRWGVRCPEDATVLRSVAGVSYALCDFHRQVLWQLHLAPLEPVKMYHRIWADGK